MTIPKPITDYLKIDVGDTLELVEDHSNNKKVIEFNRRLILVYYSLVCYFIGGLERWMFAELKSGEFSSKSWGSL